MIEKKSWKEFKDAGMLFVANKILQIFGWSLVVVVDGDDVVNMYPARSKFRGFSEEAETENCAKIYNYMESNADELRKDLES